MDFLSNQFSKLFASGSASPPLAAEASIASIPKGSLVWIQTRPDGADSIETVVYKKACIVIKNFNQSKYQFQLVVSNLSDDDQELPELDPSLKGIDELEASFLLMKSLFISRMGNEIIWSDGANDESEGGGWKFIADPSITLKQLENWEEQMYLCLYESVFQRDSESAHAGDLVAFVEKAQKEAKDAEIGVWKPAKNPFYSTPQKPNASKAPSSSSKSSPAFHTPKESLKMTFSPLTKHSSGSIPQGSTLSKVSAHLFYFDTVQAGFVQYLDQVVTAEIRQTGEYVYHLIVSKKDSTPILLQQLEQKMNPFCDFSNHSFTWVWFDPESNKPFVSWSLHFDPESNEESSFNRVFYGSMYESVNRESLAKTKSDQQEYLQQVFQDDDAMDVDYEAELQEEEYDVEEPKKTLYESVEEQQEQENDGAQNSLLAVGYKNDRSFVVRGNKIGVFKHGDDQLEFSTAIKNISDLSGNLFSPRKVMLHQQDSKLVMMHPDQENKLHVMDLEYGKVVDEWHVDEHIPIQDIIPDKKYAQLTGSQTMVGINSKAMFQIDGRLDKNKMVSSSLSQYKTKVGFSAATTTGDGRIAVASEKGEIRLFDRFGLSRAKTTLPGVGDPIIGMDTTEDGKFILATCATYLLVIETSAQGEAKSAFEKSIKTKPKRLQLKPEHVAWMGQNVSFTPARFDTGENSMEKTIITSTGPFVITWNFRKVKNGKLHEYNIKKYGENVVADNFKYGADKNIIVALPSNVEMVNKSMLQTPTKLLKSRSNIVNSPY